MINNNEFIKNNEIILEYASNENVDLLIKWTLDPVAQGPYKVVPNMTEEQLKYLFLNNNERKYYLIKDKHNNPIGRFYFRSWHFDKNPEKIDWELNILIADPTNRGKGYGTLVQLSVTEFLLKQKVTKSVFAYTMNSNIAEQKSLEKCGYKCLGKLPNIYYKVDLGSIIPEDFVLYYIENLEL